MGYLNVIIFFKFRSFVVGNRQLKEKQYETFLSKYNRGNNKLL